MVWHGIYPYTILSCFSQSQLFSFPSVDPCLPACPPLEGRQAFAFRPYIMQFRCQLGKSHHINKNMISYPYDCSNIRHKVSKNTTYEELVTQKNEVLFGGVYFHSIQLLSYFIHFILVIRIFLMW